MAELRKDKGLTQPAFGKLFNLSKDTISKYENNKSEPSDALLLKFAEFFDVSTDYLLGGSRDSVSRKVQFSVDRKKQSIKISGKVSGKTWSDIESYLDYILNKN